MKVSADGEQSPLDQLEKTNEPMNQQRVLEARFKIESINGQKGAQGDESVEEVAPVTLSYTFD